jgi:predicted DNA-binding transcriptional regulator AlpA
MTAAHPLIGRRNILRSQDVAALLDHSAGWFYANKPDLEAAGFPKKDDLLGGWNRLAVEQWLAKRSGVGNSTTAEDRLIERAKKWGASR